MGPQTDHMGTTYFGVCWPVCCRVRSRWLSLPKFGIAVAYHRSMGANAVPTLSNLIEMPYPFGWQMLQAIHLSYLAPLLVPFSFKV